jgi:hypothetical protein
MTQDAGRLPDRDELGRAAYDAADRACRESNPLIASREAPWQELAEVTKEVWRAVGEAAAARALGCQGLALYIWEGVLSDYTDGLVVALAGSLEEAHAAVRAKAPTAATILFDRKDPWPPTKVLPVAGAEPEAWVVEGGG